MIFPALEAAQAGFAKSQKEYSDAISELYELKNISQQRINAQRTRDKGRINDLEQAMRSSGSRAQSLLFSKELEDLRGAVYLPTDTERCAFSEAVATANELLQKARKSCETLKDLTQKAKAEADAIRSSANKTDFVVLSRQIDNIEREFQKLCTPEVKE